MNHRDEQLQRYFDGELPDPERAELEAALSDDDRVRLLVMGDMRQALDGTLMTDAGDVDLWAGIEKRLDGVVVPLKPRRRGMWVAGASIAMAAAVSLFLMLRPHAPTNQCDIESLDVEGAVASVAKVGEPGQQVTVIWTTEDK